ncbi:MAG TPA: tellurite resistance/C4-dicarboxylate transporter family protein [Phycisphaeraceae bacterium]
MSRALSGFSFASPEQAVTQAAAPSPGQAGLRELNPAYFALVMATGIVSIAAHLLGMAVIGAALFWFNVIAYAVLWALTIARLSRYPDAVRADLLDHHRCVGFFTTVAATCVLASQCLVLYQAQRVALALGALGLALWAVATYTIFAILTVKRHKPDLAAGIHGGWLVAVVATQSVAVIAAQLATTWGGHDPILFVALVMWLGGGMLYIWMISLIFYRYTFFPFSPGDLRPPYWINMGAVAISTLAGALLVQAAPHAPFLAGMLAFLKGFTLFFWATATGWIPMLLILGVWRHIYCRFPLRYDPLYWGAVFPLGMYTVATWRLAEAIELPFIQWIPKGFIWIALAAWTATCLGLMRALLSQARQWARAR